MDGLQNPFLRGMLSSQMAAERGTANQIQNLGGMLSIQDALESRPLKQEQLRIALDNARLNQAIRQGLLGGGSGGALGSAGPAPMAFGEGGVSLPGGGQGNLATGQTVGPQAVPRAGGQPGMGLPREVSMALLSGDPGLVAWGKEQAKAFEPRAITEGGALYIPGQGFVAVRPKIGEGVQATGYGPTGELTGVQPIPGYTGAQEAITGATERGRARYDLVTRPPVSPNAPPTYASRLDLLGGGQAIPQSPVTPPGGWQVPPAVQAGRDAQAGAIRRNELQPGGGGMIPSGSVLPSAAPNAAGMSPEQTATQAATQAGAISAAQERGKSGVEFENAVLQKGQSARTNLTQLQILAPNLDKLPTGPLYPTLVNGASYFKQFGIDVGQVSKDLGPAQATDAILKQFALKLRDPAGGGGMPGALSNSDREFLVNMLPGLNKVPDGNKQLIKILSTLEQRKIDEASIVTRMQNDKKGSGEIRSALEQFANSRPIFTQ